MISSKQLEEDHLLKIIIEQLKLPLIQIARQAEQAKQGVILGYNDISCVAEMSIKLIDSYLLTRGQNYQVGLELEPVSISSVLNEAANNLSDLSKMYNCKLELRLDGKYAPVMSQKDKLEAAFTMLGYAYIEANLSNSSRNNPSGRIVLRGYKSAGKIVGGVFSPEIEINGESFQKAISGVSSSRQAVPEISQTTGAGMLIANSIFSDLATNLRVARYRRVNGLVASLLPSQQLQLI